MPEPTFGATLPGGNFSGLVHVHFAPGRYASEGPLSNDGSGQLEIWGAKGVRQRYGPTDFGRNAVQDIIVTQLGTDFGGSQMFVLFRGDTIFSPWGASGSDLQSVMETMPSIGAGNISINNSSLPQQLYEIQFINDLGNQEIDDLIEVGAVGGDLTGSAFVQRRQLGAAARTDWTIDILSTDYALVASGLAEFTPVMPTPQNVYVRGHANEWIELYHYPVKGNIAIETSVFPTITQWFHQAIAGPYPLIFPSTPGGLGYGGFPVKVYLDDGSWLTFMALEGNVQYDADTLDGYVRDYPLFPPAATGNSGRVLNDVDVWPSRGFTFSTDPAITPDNPSTNIIDTNFPDSVPGPPNGFTAFSFWNIDAGGQTRANIVSYLAVDLRRVKWIVQHLCPAGSTAYLIFYSGQRISSSSGSGIARTARLFRAAIPFERSVPDDLTTITITGSGLLDSVIYEFPLLEQPTGADPARPFAYQLDLGGADTLGLALVSDEAERTAPGTEILQLELGNFQFQIVVPGEVVLPDDTTLNNEGATPFRTIPVALSAVTVI